MAQAKGASAKTPTKTPAPTKTLEEETVETTELSEDEEAILDDKAPKKNPLDGVTSPDEIPEWVLPMPAEVKLPKAGRQIVYMRFPAKWCEDPSLGDHQCILWSLSERDEVQAYTRARGDQNRAMQELSKGCIRVLDGIAADWGGNNPAGSVNTFWNMIGPKGRSMVRNYYGKTHLVDPDEALDFFSNHFAVGTAL